MKKSVKLSSVGDERILESFYKSVISNNLSKLHIPCSDVFYIRAAIESRTGVRYSLSHVERALNEEGML